jgi:hypothetical protein
MRPFFANCAPEVSGKQYRYEKESMQRLEPKNFRKSRFVSFGLGISSHHIGLPMLNIAE